MLINSYSSGVKPGWIDQLKLNDEGCCEIAHRAGNDDAIRDVKRNDETQSPLIRSSII